MHPMTTVALQVGVVRRLVRIGNVSFGRSVGDAQIGRAPGNLVIAAVLMAAEAGVHLDLQTGQRFAEVVSQVGDRFRDLLLEAARVTIGALDASRRVVAGQHDRIVE